MLFFIDTGLIEIISPPGEFYPDMASLKQTLGDDMERVTWRSKQALDFSFLMMYAKDRGTFYVQLEDDVLTKKVRNFGKIFQNIKILNEIIPELHINHETFRPWENCRKEALVCYRLLPAWLHWEDVQVDGIALAGQLLPHVLQ